MFMPDNTVRFNTSYLSPLSLPPTALTSVSTASGALGDSPIMMLPFLLLWAGLDLYF